LYEIFFVTLLPVEQTMYEQTKKKMKTISITPASETVIPFLRELLSNPAWVFAITVHDSKETTFQSVPSFLCSVEELNDSLCGMEEKFAKGEDSDGLTSEQMRKKHAV
jgi:hypothetical protein